jgi:organic hydroperoxide reductase OsmC/OhrA
VAGTKHVFKSSLAWTGGPSGRDFSLRTGTGAAIAGSAPDVFKGDGTRASPEDMTVAALAACHLLTYLALCARKGIRVVAYEDESEATLDRVGPGKTKFVEAILRPRVRVADAAHVGAATALHHDAHEACFVANSVNFPVRVEPTVGAG